MLFSLKRGFLKWLKKVDVLDLDHPRRRVEIHEEE